MASFRPTPEQEAAVAAFTAGDHVVLQAGAGSGKTATLHLLADSTSRRGRYIAFNKSIAQEAARKFPGNVKCGSAHALAFAVVGKHYMERLAAPRMASAKLAQVMGIHVKGRAHRRTQDHRRRALLRRAGDGDQVLPVR